jgi:CDP-diacylglycerol--glycerol-3-phosphate 3-phosphatidyltransferase
MSGRIWTISNALSMLRVVLVVPVAYLLLVPGEHNRLLLILLIVIASLTDLFDGILARRLNQVTEVGKVIDPIADKICVGVVGIVLVYKGMLPVWFIVFALVRDVVIFFCGMYIKRTRGVIVMSNWAGKWATAAIASLFLLAVVDIAELHIVTAIFLAASTVMLGLSSVLYAIRFRSMLLSSETAASIT